MKKYTDTLKKDIRGNLEALNFVFRDNFIISDSNIDDNKILVEMFGLQDDLFELFDIDFIAKVKRESSVNHFFIYNRDCKSPIVCVSKNFKLGTIRIGYAHKQVGPGKTPIWYITPPSNSLCGLNSSIIEEKINVITNVWK